MAVTESHYFHTSGAFEVTVPAGDLRITALRGFEYTPVEARVAVTASGAHDVTLRLSRGIDMPARLGTESEVSGAIVFLLSPAAAYITGVTLPVDGGSQFHKGRLQKMGGHRGLRPFDVFHLKPDFSGTPFERRAEPKG
jgi:hypothetical protein